MTVSIIILSYNTKDLLLDCLRSVYDQLADLSFEVIVADNHSTDESVQAVKKVFPKVVVIENKENLGFAKGVNAAAKIAQGEYLFFLNSDAKLLDSHLDDMLALFEKDAHLGIVGGHLLERDGRSSQSAGKFFTIPAVFQMMVGVTQKEQPLEHVYEVDWVSGGFMVIRKDLFAKLSGFDERLFMYIEDMELCYRAKRMGFTVYYYPMAKAEHMGQGSSNRSFAVTHIYKGLLYFYKKHKSYPEYLVVKLLLTLKAYSAIIIGTVSGNTYLTKTYREAVKF